MPHLMNRTKRASALLSLMSVFTCSTLLSSSAFAFQSLSDHFSEYTSASEVEINYPDVNAVLDISVIDLGMSNREKAQRPLGSTGTLLKRRINRLTALESNRVYFENFDKNNYRQAVSEVQDSLASLPSQAPLVLFNKNEQLAYWLNLYNVTLLKEMAYNESNVNFNHEFAQERESAAFNKKVIEVDGQDLSLNDIKYDIVLNNFTGNSNVIYGFFTGVIGGPSIQSRAFTGSNVNSLLKEVASEFINSNRGTYYDGRISSLYARYSDFFEGEDKAVAIKNHVLKYINDDMRDSIESTPAQALSMDITDYAEAGVGDDRVYAAGQSYNRGAIMSTEPVITTGFENLRFSLDGITLLREINQKYNMAKGNVTVKDLSESEATTSSKTDN
ncbi:hypothetical protein D210916BOD24_22100 [Alteromonas sp. D210916BOD_24]|uniref:DUF547 domain-containing protein n=1 Tax=Alteromonas sp. D210916BOD_24 TaxID=3157618 RepID=UPI00399D455E